MVPDEGPLLPIAQSPLLWQVYLRKETRARELTLQALYQHDLVEDRTLEQLLSFCARTAPDDVMPLASRLLQGCIEHQSTLDKLIGRTAENWKLERMAVSDRNILRLAVYEVLFRPETPPKVAINEAIELAKRYSTENSPTFVNGVLDRIYSTHVVDRIQPDPEARADLHVHSTASDGSVPPSELPAMAARAGLAAMALTDHDTLEGVEAAAEAGRESSVIVVPGIEVTGYAAAPDGEDEVEIHILGLYVDVADKGLAGRLEEIRATRVERVRNIAARLRELGADVSADDILARAGGESVGRVHVAQELVERGVCRDLTEAFDRYLARGNPAYVPKEHLTTAEAISLVHLAGGCAVLAHPGLLPHMEMYLPDLVEAGLDALEVHYPRHSANQEKELMDLAETYDLLVSGGSDFHGDAKPDISLGQETVSFIELHKLQQRALARV